VLVLPRPRILAAVAALALSWSAAGAETLGDALRSRRLTPPPKALPFLEQIVEGILDDAPDLLVVSTAGEGQSARLHATRFERGAQTWTTAPLEWSASTAGSGARIRGLDDWCRSQLAIARFPGGFVLRAHINPSAECTVVLGKDLAVRGVLAGWPVAMLADGRIVYQRNQVHFASVHPVALALFDPRRPGDVTVYPREPYQAIRSAHIARMRAAYTEAWCRTRNHPCDPEVFDEDVSGEVVVDARGDALAFVMVWDNTAGWSDAERWGRLEAFRELRAALARWDGQGEPPADLFRAVAAGLTRVRNSQTEAHVAAALAGEPALRDLVGAALATRAAAGQDDRTWLVALDARWADAETWRRLGRAVQVPDALTEVVYVYTGLRRSGRPVYREFLRPDFDAQFGPGAPRRALEPDVLRRIFRPAGKAGTR
jgi:hypothetical protein